MVAVLKIVRSVGLDEDYLVSDYKLEESVDLDRLLRSPQVRRVVRIMVDFNYEVEVCNEKLIIYSSNRRYRMSLFPEEAIRRFGIIKGVETLKGCVHVV